MTLTLSHWAFPTWTEGHHKLYYGHTARLTPLDESYFVVCMSTLYADPTTSTSSSPHLNRSHPKHPVAFFAIAVSSLKILVGY
ncbi:hypothetical protein SISNIDRAFT_457824, partial [Sistotremastrum niveocremeum HHB9708]